MIALEFITAAASVIVGALLGIGALVLACLSAPALLWVLVAAARWIPPFLGRAYQLARRILGITSPSAEVTAEAQALAEAAKVNCVAAAIAEEAGHNWAAPMMPEYRAEFRRQARAAIAAHEAAR